MSFVSPDFIVVSDGETFVGGSFIQFTVLADAVVSDNDGNVFGSFTAGETLEGTMPKGAFTVTSGSIKIWKK